MLTIASAFISENRGRVEFISEQLDEFEQFPSEQLGTAPENTKRGDAIEDESVTTLCRPEVLGEIRLGERDISLIEWTVAFERPEFEPSLLASLGRNGVECRHREFLVVEVEIEVRKRVVEFRPRLFAADEQTAFVVFEALL